MKQLASGKTCSECGVALIEFALLVSGLLGLCLGFVGFAFAITNAITLSACAQAGARYGTAEGNSNDTAGITAAATKAAYGLSGLSVKPSTWCACSAGGGAVSCSTTCNTYDLPIQYVQVQTSASIPLLFRFAGIPLNIQMSSSATMRAK